MASVIDTEDALQRLTGFPGWRLDAGAIVKEYTFAGFPDAVAFVSLLVAPAEAADHHPDLEIHYNRVVVRFSTHSEGGLTAKDFAGAADADQADREQAARTSARE